MSVSDEDRKRAGAVMKCLGRPTGDAKSAPDDVIREVLGLVEPCGTFVPNARNRLNEIWCAYTDDLRANAVKEKAAAKVVEDEITINTTATADVEGDDD